MSRLLANAVNYLVPAAGTTKLYEVTDNFTSDGLFVDFNQLGIDGQNFTPSGVNIDNTQGTGDIIILINEINYRIVCRAGQQMQVPYPAPVGHSATIFGSGGATVIFVDYPVIPFVY